MSTIELGKTESKGRIRIDTEDFSKYFITHASLPFLNERLGETPLSSVYNAKTRWLWERCLGGTVVDKSGKRIGILLDVEMSMLTNRVTSVVCGEKSREGGDAPERQ